MGYHRLTVEHVVLSHKVHGMLVYELHALYHRLRRLYQTLVIVTHHFGSE